MTYTDIFFLVLFAALALVCRLLRPWPAVKEWLIIAFSLLLIATWGIYDVTLFVVMLLVNFGGATAIARADEAHSKTLLKLLIALDLAVLFTFKYTGFIGENVHSVAGLALPKFPLGIPLAISFYTFHLISYLVDLQAKKVRLASFRQYCFYLSFFPHVIAGPIVRVWQLIPQIGHTRRVANDYAMGIHYMVVGYFLKMIVANNIAEGIDPVWTSTSTFQLSTLEYWLTAFLYYCQIYADFAGYTLMALGMARLLGYRLPPNFRTPFIAKSLREFWQRWHITLSKWLRDYLYIPLGGNRTSSPRVALNLMLTLMLGGLWHGAGWGFLIWGTLHGIGMVVEHRLRQPLASFVKKISGRKIGLFFFILAGWLFTQTWVTLAWVFFRSPDIHFAFLFLRHMTEFSNHGGLVVHKVILLAMICAVPVLLHQAAPWFLLRLIPRRALGLTLGLLTGIIWVLNIVVSSPQKNFLYFRF